MRHARTSIRVHLALALGLALLPASPALLAQPAPELAPEAVVRAQLEGFLRGDSAGIAEAFAFASPQNQQYTGPVARFEAMIREQYAELLGHRAVELAPTAYDDGHAYQGVEVIAADGTAHFYIFVLTRYELPGCTGCWLTEGVAKRAAEDSERGL